MIVLDQSTGLPPAGDALLAARPPDAVPIDAGDVTLALRRVRLCTRCNPTATPVAPEGLTAFAATDITN